MIRLESDLVKNLKSQIKKTMLGSVVLKINDKSSSGIPDLSVTHNDTHVWLETKLLKKYETKPGFKKHIDLLQLGTCCLLERAGRCFYIMQFAENQILTIRPSKVYFALDKPRAAFDFYTDIKFASVCCGSIETTVEFLSQTMKEPKAK